MNPNEDTITMFEQLQTEVREVFESHLPGGYAKEYALENLENAFNFAKEAVEEATC